jgi:hypothetical protein
MPKINRKLFLILINFKFFHQVKVPLELINNSLEFIKSEKILADDGIENHKEVIAIQLQVYTINLLTDNILFLSTTHEGRFEFKSELVNVMYLLQVSIFHNHILYSYLNNSVQ